VSKAEHLEARLGDLAAHLDLPPTPALAGAVLALIAAESPGERPPRRRRRSLALGLAAAVATAGVALALPGPRTAVAHWLGIGRVEIRPVPSLPPVPTPSTSGVAGTLGRRVGLEEAARTAGFSVLLPAELGAPGAVYVRDDLPGAVSLVYPPRPGLTVSGTTGVGLLVTELHADVDGSFLQKFVGPDATVLPVTVAGGPGFWIGGAPHAVGYSLPGGATRADDLRLAGPTLLWQRGGITLRIEGALTEQRALELAATFH
jgi:hypothetical protein